jgi:uncharacterized protein YneF (UPF0154 family)
MRNKIIFGFLFLLCMFIGTCAIKQEHNKKELKENGIITKAKIVGLPLFCGNKPSRNKIRVEVNGNSNNTLPFTKKNCKEAYVGKEIDVLTSPNTGLVILPNQNYNLLFAYFFGAIFYVFVPLFLRSILFPISKNKT